MWLFAFERARAVHVLAALLGVLVTLLSFGSAPPAAAQGTATIEITNLDAGTGLPAPFTRFQVTSENGTVYGPLETDLNGYVAFSVTVDPQGTSFTVIEETSPACATAPEPQTTDPLAAGELASLSFSTQDNPGCGLGTIALYAMTCPEGFTGPIDDYGPWRDGCTGTSDGTSFTLTSDGTGETWTPVAGEFGIPGRAPVVGLPAGDYTFQQDGEAPTSAFCLVYDTANYATSPDPSSVLPVPLTNGAGAVSLTGNRISCDLFTVPGGVSPLSLTAEPVDPAAAATLDIHLAECPASYLGGDAIYDDCHGNGMANIPVQLSATNGFSGTIATSLPETPGPGVASFTNLADGTYTIGASVPADASFATFCSDDAFVEVPSTFDETTLTLTLDLEAGQVVTCDWYVIPNAVVPAVGTSYFELHALQCPAGTDPNDDLYDLCHATGAAGVTFAAEGPGGYVDQVTTTVPASPGPGVATLDQLVDGSYAITQLALDPSDDLVVYCSLADADDTVPFSYSAADTISLDLPADTGVVCDWYVIPPAAEATTSLQIDVFRCPNNFNADDQTPLAAFQTGCSPSTGTSQYSITPEGGEPITQIEGSAGVGSVRFDALSSGTYSFGTSIPGDFNDPYLFCGVEGGELLPADFHLSIDVNQGPYRCQWFNDPFIARGESETLTITNYLCPPGTADAYEQRCASPLAGATFSLDLHGTETLDDVTDASGVATFTGFLIGESVLTHLPPAGTAVAVYVVACESDGQPFDFEYSDQQSMSIALDLSSSAVVDCAWYNIPPGTPTVAPGQNSGAIVVHKFLCQGKSVNQYNWDKDCTAETAPVAFSLATASGSPIAVGTTNTSGILTFTNLANGAYNLDETSGDWCHAEADLVDSAGNVLVRNGGENHVYIYNCSLQNVDNLPSTGTGQTSSVTRVPFDGDKLWQLLFGALATLGIALVVRHGLHQAVVQSTQHAEEPQPSARVDENPR